MNLKTIMTPLMNDIIHISKMHKSEINQKITETHAQTLALIAKLSMMQKLANGTELTEVFKQAQVEISSDSFPATTYQQLIATFTGSIH